VLGGYSLDGTLNVHRGRNAAACRATLATRLPRPVALAVCRSALINTLLFSASKAVDHLCVNRFLRGGVKISDAWLAWLIDRCQMRRRILDGLNASLSSRTPAKRCLASVGSNRAPRGFLRSGSPVLGPIPPAHTTTRIAFVIMCDLRQRRCGRKRTCPLVEDLKVYLEAGLASVSGKNHLFAGSNGGDHTWAMSARWCRPPDSTTSTRSPLSPACLSGSSQALVPIPVGRIGRPDCSAFKAIQLWR
jgi:hypothetical protein